MTPHHPNHYSELKDDNGDVIEASTQVILNNPWNSVGEKNLDTLAPYMDAGFVAVNRDLNTVDRANDTPVQVYKLPAFNGTIGEMSEWAQKYEWSPDATGYSEWIFTFYFR